MESGVDEVFAQPHPPSPPPVSETLMAKLLAALDCRANQTQAVSLELQSTALDYVRQRKQDGVKAGVAGVNKALAMIELKAAAAAEARRALNDALATLNSEAAWVLLMATQRRRPSLDALDPHDLRSYPADDIARAAADARVHRDGCPPDPTLAVAIGRLVAVFERETGRRATHTPSKDPAHRSGPRSEVGRFIAAFFSGVAPKFPPSRLSSALDNLLKARRARAA